MTYRAVAANSNAEGSEDRHTDTHTHANDYICTQHLEARRKIQVREPTTFYTLKTDTHTHSHQVAFYYLDATQELSVPTSNMSFDWDETLPFLS